MQYVRYSSIRIGCPFYLRHGVQFNRNRLSILSSARGETKILNANINTKIQFFILNLGNQFLCGYTEGQVFKDGGPV